MIRAYFGVAHPWLCDNLGHLNTRNYVGMFDDAGAHYLAIIGWSPTDASEKRIDWADVRGEIEYKAEVAVGELVTIDIGTEAVGTKSLTMYSEMRNTISGELHATMRSVLVYFDLEARCAIPVPDDLRKAAAAIDCDRTSSRSCVQE